MRFYGNVFLAQYLATVSAIMYRSPGNGMGHPNDLMPHDNWSKRMEVWLVSQATPDRNGVQSIGVIDDTLIVRIRNTIG